MPAFASESDNIYSEPTALCEEWENVSDAHKITFERDNIPENDILARNVQSNDTADKLYGAGYGREERTLVPIKITNQMKAKLRHVAEAKYNFFTFDNHDYPETKMVVKPF